MDEGTRVCSKCGKEKSITEYHRHGGTDRDPRYRPDCKSCVNERARSNQAQRTKYMRNYRAHGPKKPRKKR